MADAIAVAAPESHMRLIFQVDVVGEDEAEGNTLSIAQFSLCGDTGSFVSGWRGRAPFFFAVIAGFCPFVFVDVIEKLRGFGCAWL